MAKAIAEKYKPLSLAEIRKRRKASRDVVKVRHAKAGKLDRAAVWITEHVGTMCFFLIIFCWTALWLGWNLLAPKNLQFDPPMGFVLWLFLSNLIQLMLMPLIMLGQNVQGQQADVRAQHDLDVNVKAEQEIETILYHLEYQNGLLLAMVEKLGIKPEGEHKKINHTQG